MEVLGCSTQWFRWFIAFTLGILLAGSSASAAETVRTWRDDTGQFEIKAVLVKANKDSVELRKEDGQVLNVPIARLSADDQAYLKSVDQANPFAARPKTPQLHGAEALVMVIAEAGGRTQMMPAIVYRHDAARAYVAATSVVDPSGPGRREALQQRTFAVARESAQGRTSTKGELVMAVRDQAVFSIDATSAPAAVKPATASWTEAMNVYVAGYEVDQTATPPSFARTTSSGIVRSIFRTAGGPISHVELEGNGLERLNGGLVFDSQGQPIAYLGRRPVAVPLPAPAPYPGSPGAATAPPAPAAPPPRITAIPLAKLADIEEPQLLTIRIVSHALEGQKLTCELVVVWHDPFKKLREPRLLVAPQNVAHNIGPGKFSDQAATVALVEGKPSVELPQRSEPNGLTTVTLVGKYTTEVPGPQKQYTFVLQAVSNDAQGQPVYVHPLTYGFSAEKHSANSFPSLPTKPLDLPQPVKHPVSGWVLTSEATGAKMQGLKAPRAAWPAPVTSRRSLFGGKVPTENGDVVRLSLAVDRASGERTVPALAYSQDGAVLFLVDNRNVLHRMGTADYRESATLDLGMACSEMTASKAGLLLGFRKQGLVWVVDPDTLRVQREIALADVAALEGARDASIGFALCNKEATGGWGQASALIMIDFGRGVVLHTIPLSTGRQVLHVADQPVIGAGGASRLKLSNDGRYLFLGGDRVVRLRVEPAALVFEEAGPELAGGVAGGLVLSGDGRIAVPGPYVQHRQQFSLYDARKPAAAPEIVDAGERMGLIGFDAKNGNLYGLDSLVGAIFIVPVRATAKKILTLGIGHGVRKVVMHPQGERLALYHEEWVTCIDTVRGRPLPAGIKPPDGKQLTSDTTRVSKQRAVDESRPLPVPERTSGSVAQGKWRLAQVDAVALNLPVRSAQEHSPPRMPMIFSADGNWLYVVDNQNVLHKIGCDDLKEDRQLKLGAACHQISACKEGLLVGFEKEGLWIVNPDTLQVIRSLPIAHGRSVTGSRKSSIGFVVDGVLGWDGASRAPSSLVMIDFAQGKLLHRIPLQPQSEMVLQGLIPLTGFGNEVRDIQMTADGDFLLLATDNTVSRFRLKEGDLYFQQRSPHLIGVPHVRYELDSYNRLELTRSKQGSDESKTAAYDVRDLEMAKFPVSRTTDASPRIDPATKRWIIPSGVEFVLYDAAGREERKVNLLADTPIRLLVHPNRDRLACWTKERILFYDLVPGRLKLE